MKIKLTRIKLIEIDLDKIRGSMKGVRYGKGERQRLLKFYDLFEQGRFQECIDFTETWGRTNQEYPEVEHIDMDAWNILACYAANDKLEITE